MGGGVRAAFMISLVSCFSLVCNERNTSGCMTVRNLEGSFDGFPRRRSAGSWCRRYSLCLDRSAPRSLPIHELRKRG